MKRSKVLRIGGFVTAVCATTALVAAAAQSTGAWFTDSHSGTIASSSGHLNLLIKNAAGTYADADTSQMNLAYSDLMPGESRDKTIDYQVSASGGKMDLWLTFDPTTQAYGEFTGTNGQPYGSYTGGGMGGYGHFKVVGDSGYSFESYNLQLPSGHSNGNYGTTTYTETNANGTCVVNTNGNGGEHTSAVGPSNANDSVPECGVPAAIKLASDLPSGTYGTVTVTFGLTGKQANQGQTEPTVGYKLVATQAGHAPGDANF